MVRDTKYHPLNRDPARAPSDRRSEPAAPVSYDGLVHQLFAASLELHAALALIDNRYAADKIHDAIEGLDQTINRLRRVTFAQFGTNTSRPLPAARGLRHAEPPNITGRRGLRP